ncbi:probable tubulin polyglutamylase TTLL2 [Thrips palmi]|uniref:Probable tubulin polyglutamylase TTLL2 n=1 Tax=Thrips palmi TaxID=161013 RepID=A0A6P8XXD7_THRPL|nr:probable tubulin polyglutamylase TTLL2 [Thrips palmi]
MAAFDGPFIFRINEAGNPSPGPYLLWQVCHERGWRPYSEGSTLRDHWNLWWRTGGHSPALYKQLRTWQFTNHIPKGSSICRKDKLARSLAYMRRVYGPIYDISPHSYNLPQEYTKLIAECSRQAADNSDRDKPPSTVWICKPVGQSQGRGIFLFRSVNELSCSSSSVVQRYVQDPLLIAGYKFDLRLYVCVPSFHPLRVYLYREGLARFSTERFSLKNLDNLYCHLTNTSLNKQGPAYSEMKERVGAAGCKWTLQQLRRHFHQARLGDWWLWQRISQLVVLTVLSQLRGVPRTANCFEVYGFDVLIDAAMRPWLLEVNMNPAMTMDCDADPVVKKPMLHDLFDLLGMPVCNTGLSLFRIWSKNTPPALSVQLQRRHEEQQRQQYLQRQQRQQHLQQRASSHKHYHQSSGSSQGSGSSGTEGGEEDEDAASPRRSPRRKNTSAITAVAAAGMWRRRSQTASASAASHRTAIRSLARSASVDGDESPSPSAGAGRAKKVPVRVEAGAGAGDGWGRSHPPPPAPAARTAARSRKVRRSSGPDDADGGDAVQLINNGDGWRRPRPSTTTTRRGRSLWGNGRDWSRAPAVEGDWVRVYPTCDSWMASEEDPGPSARLHDDDAAELVPVGDKEVKAIVATMQKLSRMTRDAHRRYPSVSDEEHQRLVTDALGEDAVLWLPPS